MAAGLRGARFGGRLVDQLLQAPRDRPALLGGQRGLPVIAAHRARRIGGHHGPHALRRVLVSHVGEHGGEEIPAGRGGHDAEGALTSDVQVVIMNSADSISPCAAVLLARAGVWGIGDESSAQAVGVARQGEEVTAARIPACHAGGFAAAGDWAEGLGCAVGQRCSVAAEERVGVAVELGRSAL